MKGEQKVIVASFNCISQKPFTFAVSINPKCCNLTWSTENSKLFDIYTLFHDNWQNILKICNSEGGLWLGIVKVGDQVFFAFSSDIKFLPALFSLKIEEFGFNYKRVLLANQTFYHQCDHCPGNWKLLRWWGGFCFFSNSISARFCSSVCTFMASFSLYTFSSYCFRFWFHSARIIYIFCTGFHHFLILASASSRNNF